MTEQRIPIRSNWDAALTYDSLNEPLENGAVFVGRDTLIAPLVAEICEPNKRGTYLISGYRGTGKTTLLIEALRRAQEQLPKGHQLFPLILNVSEVSASLGSVTTGASDPLNIDPRRLLVALLRTIAHRIRRLAANDSKLEELAGRAHKAYEKATAAKFAQTVTRAEETIRARSREWKLSLENKDVLKTIACAAGAAAVALESAAWIGPTFGWLHGTAAALAITFGVSLKASSSRSSGEKQSTGDQTAVEHDNSLQQLETDLKDILTELKQKQLRTVVVMEELDKIADSQGVKLADVICYFKNLFTQAPALFFFVTDKSYFDIISTAIKRARRQRSYAVEHTFFTHRLFVGRPNTKESLQFIDAILTEPADKKALAEVEKTLGKPGRGDDTDPLLGRFVRVVLFAAANHLFDLKNELRRFVSIEETKKDGEHVTSFLINDQTLPPEEAALAVFQDLIIAKTRSFEIKGGRTYANETLADSLYAVFNELGSDRPQSIASFMPNSNADPTGLLLDEQLNLNEVARVREAVNSLIGDLGNGQALTSDEAGVTFTWRADAARSFRYVRQPEHHEKNLAADLQRHAALVAALGPLAPVDTLAPAFEKQASDVLKAIDPMSADAAAEASRDMLDRYSTVLTSAFSKLYLELSQSGFVFDPVAQGLAGSLYFVRPLSGDTRFSPVSLRGGVLLAFGETERLLEDVWSFIRPESTQGLNPLNHLALVHVIHATGNVGAEVKSRSERWNQAITQRRGVIAHFRFHVDVIALVDPDRDPTLTLVERIAAALAGFGAWSRFPQPRLMEPLPETPLLASALKEWIASEVSLLHIALPPAVPPQGIKARYFDERDEIEKEGRTVLGLHTLFMPGGSLFEGVAQGCMRLGYDQALLSSTDSLDRMGRWLLSEDLVVLFVKWDGLAGWTVADVAEALKAGARVIFSAPEPLPAEFEPFSRTLFPPSATPRAGVSQT